MDMTCFSDLFWCNIVKKTNIVISDQVHGGADMQVNILEAKTNLSNLVRLVETGREECIIIARYGKPVAKIVLYNDVPVSKRIGVAKGKLKSPDNLDQYNDEIAEMFEGTL
jgi:antitoxin (DNA-binding transcriptional repressor) of toxin-antitoxin stability system